MQQRAGPVPDVEALIAPAGDRIAAYDAFPLQKPTQGLPALSGRLNGILVAGRASGRLGELPTIDLTHRTAHNPGLYTAHAGTLERTW
jgi:hypothetical protein